MARRGPYNLARVRLAQRRVPEKTVQHHCASFLRAIGGQVYELGHHRSKGRQCPQCAAFVPNTDFSTRQTPGIPDIFAFVPHRPGMTVWIPVWVECKAEGGRLSPEQLEFQRFCARTGVAHVRGGLDDVIKWALERQIIHEHQVPHYRLPKAETQP